MTEFDELMDAVNQNDSARVQSALERNPELVHQRCNRGATALHVAALKGHAQISRMLIAQGADVNSRDDRFGATPAGWAIEYLREQGALLAIELDDLEFAIERRDTAWVARLIKRFPKLRNACAASGVPFRQTALQSGHDDLAALFVDG